ncbi:HAD-IIB family hydrolase [uncultured Duncaniella sp.]|uniref:HAD-IIB family hydrolase n=1 Tax=uncultured Duncaniella sp. TaxID=2768039 RepID=UPI00260C4F25|nr:HAD-IIB family hydrolase [uncultured Duncaniella sp.]
MGKTLYVSDLDGTLMQPGAYLSQKTIDMLNRSIADRKLFTIATARTPATVADIIKDVNMNIPAIVFTGAAIWDPKTKHYSSVKYMNPDAVRNLIDTYHRMHFPIFHFTLEGDVVNIYHIGGKLNDLEETFVKERIKSPYKRFHLSDDGTEISPDDISKTLIFYGMQPTELASAVHAEACELKGCRHQYYHDLYGPEIGLIDAFAPDATKAKAVMEMKEQTGADRVVVFGDNLNDIPMLEVADVAVAVENALPEVKEVADIVIGPNTADSVAEFILNDRD